MHRLAREHPSGDAGSATVWALAWVAVFVVVAGVGLALGVGVARQHQVDGAADLVALSAASSSPGESCRVAATMARANAVQLAACDVAAGDVVVTVRTRVVLPFGMRLWVTGRARAGPP